MGGDKIVHHGGHPFDHDHKIIGYRILFHVLRNEEGCSTVMEERNEDTFESL